MSYRETLDQHLHSPLRGELQNVSFWDAGIAQSMLRSPVRDAQGETDAGSSQPCMEGAQETMDLSWNKADWGWIWEGISSLAGQPSSRVGCQSLCIVIPWNFSGPDWINPWLTLYLTLLSRRLEWRPPRLLPTWLSYEPAKQHLSNIIVAPLTSGNCTRL